MGGGDGPHAVQLQAHVTRHASARVRGQGGRAACNGAGEEGELTVEG